MSRVVVLGAGATGTRIAQHLQANGGVSKVDVCGSRGERSFFRSLGRPRAFGAARPSGLEQYLDPGLDLVVIATNPTGQVNVARHAIHQGIAVVATSNRLSEVRRLLGLHQEALHNNVALVVGATFMPGLTCLLARHGAQEFDELDEIHVAKVGTGGPACARQHHQALSSPGLDWRDGRWTVRAPGSGRELAYFPDPIGGNDCYRAALPDALLLVPEFPNVMRVTARMAATRRDRLTSPLPMLRPPHAEGGLGAVRVELRGRVSRQSRVSVFGAVEQPAAAAAMVAASAVFAVLRGEFGPGACGLAAAAKPLPMLDNISSYGLRLQRFEGVSTFH